MAEEPIFAGSIAAPSGSPLSYLKFSRGAAISAAFDRAWETGPTSDIAARIQAAENMPLGGIADELNVWSPDQFQRPDPTDLVDAPTLRKRVEDEGLKFTVPDEGMSERAFEVILARRRSEAAQNTIMALGPHDLLTGAAKLGAGLAASVVDPINIASAFVPVVGLARTAAWMAQYGRSAGRLMTGAVEGTVGALMVEPVVYGLLQAEQADYGVDDLFLNIAFGTVVGGGLHVGVGKIKDIITGVPSLPPPARTLYDTLSPDHREIAVMLAIREAQSGRSVDVDPIIRALHNLQDTGVPSVREVSPQDLARRIQEGLPRTETAIPAPQLAPVARAAEGLDLQRARAISLEQTRVSEELGILHAQIEGTARELASLPPAPSGLSARGKAELVRFFEERLSRSDVSPEEKARLETDRDRLLKELPKDWKTKKFGPEEISRRQHLEKALEEELDALRTRARELEAQYPATPGSRQPPQFRPDTITGTVDKAVKQYEATQALHREIRAVLERSARPESWDGWNGPALQQVHEILANAKERMDPAVVAQDVETVKAAKDEIDRASGLTEQEKVALLREAGVVDRDGKTINAEVSSQERIRAAEVLSACLWR